MVHLLGAVLVAAGCAWGGFRAADGLRCKVRALEEAAQGLALLEQELELDNPPLPQLLERIIPRSRGPARALFQGCREALDHLEEEALSQAWRRLVSGLEELGEEGRTCLLPLGDALGRCEGGEQRQAAEVLRRRLEELAGRTDGERRRLGKVYQALGLSGGAFLVILLL